MRTPLILFSPLLGGLVLATTASAETMYVAPEGTATTPCTRATPCDLTTAAKTARAGDTVILMDGIYRQQSLNVANSGTADAWITFRADDCATPILEGPGVDPSGESDDSPQTTGVGATDSPGIRYLRFIGLVSRGWTTGFGNHWITTDETPPSNGNIEYQYCIGDGNGRTGFNHFSAGGIRIQNCIAAHNGTSRIHSWSSGITLYETDQGSNGAEAVVEGNVSFENMDAQRHTDGSGFIADENSNGAVFVNNIGFRNGGSCIRLTKSSDVRVINNTCYHDGQDPDDLGSTGPTDPGEIYFTLIPEGLPSGLSATNNVFVASGLAPCRKAVVNQPSAWNANIVSDSPSVDFFNDPEGTNPDLTLSSASQHLIGKGTQGNGVPTQDIGFDPKCIIKKLYQPVGHMATMAWWQYSVDYDYIKSNGGVAKCFSGKARSATPDIGAYAHGVVMSSPACRPSSGAAQAGGNQGAGGKLDGGELTDAGRPTGLGATAPADASTGLGGRAPADEMRAQAGGTSAEGASSTPPFDIDANASSGPFLGSTSGNKAPTPPATSGSPGGSGASAGGISSNAGTGASGSAGVGTAPPERSRETCSCRFSDPRRPTSLGGLGLLALAVLAVRRARKPQGVRASCAGRIPSLRLHRTENGRRTRSKAKENGQRLNAVLPSDLLSVPRVSGSIANRDFDDGHAHQAELRRHFRTKLESSA